MMRAAEIASSIGPQWPSILAQLGIDERFLRNKHGPCPNCGGKDRYRFDNKHGRGGFYCNRCGPGDGFALLQRVHGWDFKTVRARVLEAAGLRGEVPRRESAAVYQPTEAIAAPTRRVLKLKHEACALIDCPDAVEYLTSRGLWPLAQRTSLRAHAGCDYFEEGHKIGRHPAILAAVRDSSGDLATLHVTYLAQGRKLEGREPRKLLSPLHGREGCAVRLQLLTGDVLGIGEGIETCLAASSLHRLPIWAALNTSLLAKFTPPDEVKRLVIFADRDEPGQEAAAKLARRLADRLRIEVQTPPRGFKDWADVLAAS